MNAQEQGAEIADAIEDVLKARKAYRENRHTVKEGLAVEAAEERLGVLFARIATPVKEEGNEAP